MKEIIELTEADNEEQLSAFISKPTHPSSELDRPTDIPSA